MIVVCVAPSEEVLGKIASEMGRLGVKDAAIVSLIGAVGYARISNMPSDDASSDILTEYAQPMELSGTGEVTDGRPHIHCVLGREGDVPVFGHLHAATVDHWFVNAYILAS